MLGAGDGVAPCTGVSFDLKPSPTFELGARIASEEEGEALGEGAGVALAAGVDTSSTKEKGALFEPGITVAFPDNLVVLKIGWLMLLELDATGWGETSRLPPAPAEGSGETLEPATDLATNHVSIPRLRAIAATRENLYIRPCAFIW